MLGMRHMHLRWHIMRMILMIWARTPHVRVDWRTVGMIRASPATIGMGSRTVLMSILMVELIRRDIRAIALGRAIVLIVWMRLIRIISVVIGRRAMVLVLVLVVTVLRMRLLVWMRMLVWMLTRLALVAEVVMVIRHGWHGWQFGGMLGHQAKHISHVNFGAWFSISPTFSRSGLILGALLIWVLRKRIRMTWRMLLGIRERWVAVLIGVILLMRRALTLLRFERYFTLNLALTL